MRSLITPSALPAVAWVVAHALALAPTPAAAQEGGNEEARALLARAEGQFEAGQYALAARSYQEFHDHLVSIGNPRAPLALWNVGLSLSRVPGQERPAIEALRRFLDETASMAGDPEVASKRSEANEKISELEARLQMSSDEPTGSQPPAESGGGSRGGGISPVGPILLGIGGATLVAGIITGAVALSEEGALNEACGGDRCVDTADNRDALDGVKTLAAATDALLVIGGVTAAVGLVLTFALEDGGDSASASLSCDPTGCRAGIEGTF